MKHGLILLLCLCVLSTTSAQSNFVVESVRLINTIDNESPSVVPRLKDSTNPKNAVVDKVNASLMDRFMINSYKQSELEEFRWVDAVFQHDIKRNILYISYAGDYNGAYQNFVTEEIFYDLATGEELKNTDIPFQSLFTLKGYFGFMNKYWLGAVKPLFKEAFACAGEVEPYCSYYDVSRYEYIDQTFTCSLDDDCYPHAMLACSPMYTLTIPGDSLKPYLSNFGKELLTTNQYSKLKGIEKYMFNKKIQSQIPDNIFITGKIDGKYEFSLAIQVNHQTHKADGYYYYDRKKIPITLTGTSGTNSIQLEESSSGKVTGKMIFTFFSDYQEKGLPIQETGNRDLTYVMGVWKSPDDVKKMDITFTEIKLTNRLR